MKKISIVIIILLLIVLIGCVGFGGWFLYNEIDSIKNIENRIVELEENNKKVISNSDFYGKWINDEVEFKLRNDGTFYAAGVSLDGIIYGDYTTSGENIEFICNRKNNTTYNKKINGQLIKNSNGINYLKINLDDKNVTLKRGVEYTTEIDTIQPAVENSKIEVTKKLSPVGFAGSSMQEIQLYSNGDVYHITYNGEGTTENDIVSKELIAINASDISEKKQDEMFESIIVKCKKSDVKIDKNGWIKFEE